MRINRKKLMITMIDRDMKVSQLVEKSGLPRCTISRVSGFGQVMKNVLEA